MTTEDDQQERSTDMADHDDHDDAAKSILQICNLSPLLVKRFGLSNRLSSTIIVTVNGSCGIHFFEL
jgi:hypothetical protein